MVNFGAVAKAGFFQIPTVFPYGFEFSLAAVFGVTLVSIVSAIETVGDTSATAKAGAGRDATDEEIASSTGLRINMVRKVLYDLFGKSLITGIRVKDERKGWFVYRWRTRREEVEHFIENQKKKIEERLQQRFDYENASDFYHCGNEDCPRVTFEEALDGMFKCPSCQNVLNIKKNEKSRKAYSKKIDEIKKDMQQTF